jgi:acyl carrier protein
LKINDIVCQLTPIFREVFDDDFINVSPNMTASDVVQWDSLGNIRLMISIENAFGIRFETSEMTGAANVGELIEMISNKLGN